MPQTPALPFIHTTISLNFINCVRNGKLRPSRCRVFKEPLIYLFYGRPAYRVELEERPSQLYSSLPVCFIFKPNCISALKRIYPFDSGAFTRGLYKDHISGKFTLDDFAMDCMPEVPQHIVGAFFHSNRGYYLGNPKPISIPFTEFSTRAYFSLITDKGYREVDDRRSTIEIQCNRAINLSRDTIEAVVLPRAFLDEEELVERIFKIWEAKALDYPSYSFSPREYTGIIFESVRLYFESQGYV